MDSDASSTLAPKPPQSRAFSQSSRGNSRTARTKANSSSDHAKAVRRPGSAQPDSRSRATKGGDSKPKLFESSKSVKVRPGRPQTARARMEQAGSSSSRQQPRVDTTTESKQDPDLTVALSHSHNPYSDPGPPPDLIKRELIFDSLQKIVGMQYAQRSGSRRAGGRKASHVDNDADETTRGTYMWTCGAGYHGQLGHAMGRGEKKYRVVPQILQDKHITSPIRQVACGGFYTAAVTDDGSVFTWGDGRLDQLGHKLDSFSHQRLPGRVVFPVGTRIVKVACGEGHTMALDKHGQLFGWGNNRYSQVGTGDHYAVKQPRRLKRGRQEPVSDVSAEDILPPSYAQPIGKENIVRATERTDEEHDMSAHKSSEAGALDLQPTRTPMPVVAGTSSMAMVSSSGSQYDLSETIPLPRFVDVVCGYNHTVALTEDGQVWTWGHGGQGQLGHGSFSNQSLPVRVVALQDHCVTHVACGASNSCFVTNKGEVFLCGFGQHLYPTNDNFSSLPIKIPLKDKEPAVSSACGQAHVLVLTKGGDVYAWGSGEFFGQLGNGATSSVPSPRCVLLGKDIASVYAGRYHSVALSRTGAVYAWGCGENGELGNGKDENVSIPKVVEPCLGTVVGYVACGQHHTAFLSGAPWAHWAPDVMDFCAGERHEYALKVKRVKDNSAGLTVAFTRALTHARETKRMSTGHLALELGVSENLIIDYEKGRVVPYPQVIAQLNQLLGVRLPKPEKPRIGITRKDLLDIAQERREHDRQQKVLRQQNREDEIQREQADLRSIRRRASLAADVAKLHFSDVEETQPVQHSADPHHQQEASDAAHDDGADEDTEPKEELEETEEPDDTIQARARSSVFLDAPPLRAQTSHGMRGSSDEDGGAGPVVVLASPARAFGRPQSAHAGSYRGQIVTADRESRREKARDLVLSEADTSADSDELMLEVMPDFEAMAEDIPGAATVHTAYLRNSTALMDRLGISAQKYGTTGQKVDLEAEQELVKELQAKYDVLRADREEKTKMLQQCENTLTLEKPTGQHKQKMQRNQDHLVALQMRTSTMRLKIQEADENRQSYEQSLSHLKEDQFERYMQLEALKTKHTEITRFLARVKRQLRVAEQRKNTAEAELADFRKEVSSQRAFLATQLKNFKAVARTARNQSAARQRERRQTQNRMGKQRKNRLDKLQQAHEARNAEHLELDEKRQLVELELANCERRYRQLVVATGMDTADGIITKFRLRNELLKELRVEIAQKETRSVELKQHKEGMRQKLLVLRDEVADVSWRHVEDLEEKTRDGDFRLQQAKSRYDSLVQSLLFVQEGLTSVLSSFPRELRVEQQERELSSKADSDPLLTVVPLVKALSARLDALTSAVDL